MQPLNHAALHAANKQIEKLLSNEKLPHSVKYDVSGMQVTITFPQGTSVLRAPGDHLDGLKERKATPLLYGRLIWGLLKARLEKFNQWNAIEHYIIDTMNDFIERVKQGQAKGTLQEDIKALQEFDNDWENYLMNTFQNIPNITCDTERRITKQREATIEVTNAKE